MNMARTALTVTSIPADTATVVTSVFAAGDVVNDNVIPTGTTSGNIIVYVKNGDAAPQTVTFLAGDGGDVGPAWRSILGDLTMTVAAAGEQVLHMTDTARFLQSDGTINVDISDADVDVAVFQLS
jgi:hypothetical protein